MDGEIKGERGAGDEKGGRERGERGAVRESEEGR